MQIDYEDYENLAELRKHWTQRPAEIISIETVTVKTAGVEKKVFRVWFRPKF